MKKTFRSVRGTVDFYPPKTYLLEHIIKKAKHTFSLFNYEPLELPHLEEKGVFERGVGSQTDIVQKQMFKIEGKDIVLRPEGTAQVARFYIENSLAQQKNVHKFYYVGSMFRGERPQKGRLREFHHIGAEAIGSGSIYLDAEILDIVVRVLDGCGIRDTTLKINSLGCEDDKMRLSGMIKDKLRGQRGELCADCQKRIVHNPLRVLDCKSSRCQKVVSALGLGSEHLCPGCREHFFDLLSLLERLGIAYTYDPFLVRGLDYYTNTVFEVVSASLGAQDAIGAGGRYNSLIRSLGGPDTPAIGFALGVERMMLAHPEFDEIPAPSVFVAHTSPQTRNEAYNITRLLRDSGVRADFDYAGKSLKAQLKSASKLSVPFVLIVGEEELQEGCIVMRNMRESTQEKISLRDLLGWVDKNRKESGQL